MLTLAKKTILLIIRIYQKSLSPDHGWLANNHEHGFCKYYPTCSDYTYQAISKYGIWRGSWKGLSRVVRCNPFSKGGIDNVK